MGLAIIRRLRPRLLAATADAGDEGRPARGTTKALAVEAASAAQPRRVVERGAIFLAAAAELSVAERAGAGLLARLVQASGRTEAGGRGLLLAFHFLYIVVVCVVALV